MVALSAQCKTTRPAGALKTLSDASKTVLETQGRCTCCVRTFDETSFSRTFHKRQSFATAGTAEEVRWHVDACGLDPSSSCASGVVAMMRRNSRVHVPEHRLNYLATVDPPGICGGTALRERPRPAVTEAPGAQRRVLELCYFVTFFFFRVLRFQMP